MAKKKLNQLDPATPTLSQLFGHANPSTGKMFRGTLSQLVALFTANTPVKTYADQAAMLANTDLVVGFLALQADTGKIYLYNGPDATNISSYTQLAKLVSQTFDAAIAIESTNGSVFYIGTGNGTDETNSLFIGTGNLIYQIAKTGVFETDLNLDTAAGTGRFKATDGVNLAEIIVDPDGTVTINGVVIDFSAQQLKNIADGTDPQDAVTKSQLDSAVAGGGAVDSVNGQTGVVVLDASDVGADPSGTAAGLIATEVTNRNSAIAAATVGLWDDRGTFSAAGGAYPSSGGSGTAGAILKGDIWTISVAGTLPTGQVVEVGDTVRALIDTPGNTQANWAILQNNIGYIPENVANKATSFGTINNTLFPTIQAVNEKLDAVRLVTASSAAVQSDSNKLIIFNSATPINFTLDQLAANVAGGTTTKISYINIGAGAVTFLNGTGVTMSGATILDGATGNDFLTGVTYYDTTTNPRNVLSSSQTLHTVSPVTTGGTITLDFSNQIQRLFIGASSFATSKAIALSNNTNALAMVLMVNITNVAGVLTFPSTFTMQLSDGRWDDTAHTFKPASTGLHKFWAVFNGTDWTMEASDPYP